MRPYYTLPLLSLAIPSLAQFIVYTTETVSEIITYVPTPTKIVQNGVTYTVTEPTTLTITNCPCTVVSPGISIVGKPTIVLYTKCSGATGGPLPPIGGGGGGGRPPPIGGGGGGGGRPPPVGDRGAGTGTVASGAFGFGALGRLLSTLQGKLDDSIGTDGRLTSSLTSLGPSFGGDLSNVIGGNAPATGASGTGGSAELGGFAGSFGDLEDAFKGGAGAGAGGVGSTSFDGLKEELARLEEGLNFAKGG